MAAPKKDPCAIWVGKAKAKPIRESGKTQDRKLPISERESVRRALMRLPLDSERTTSKGHTVIHSPRREYAQRIGVGGETLLNLLNRVDGARLSTTDGHAIAVERINGESVTKVRRRRRKVVA
jgi:hypothetical protein